MAAVGPSQTMVSTTLVGASVGAGGAEVSHATETWALVGMHGFVLPPFDLTPANAVYPVSFRCPTTAGTILVQWANGTGGALTPTSASTSKPYIFVLAY